jgi:hypothetical protein
MAPKSSPATISHREVAMLIQRPWWRELASDLWCAVFHRRFHGGPVGCNACWDLASRD